LCLDTTFLSLSTTGADGIPMTIVYETVSGVGDTIPTGETDNGSIGGISGRATEAIRSGVISGVVCFTFFGVTSAPIEAFLGGLFGLVMYASLVRVVFWFLDKRAKQRRIEKEFDDCF